MSSLRNFAIAFLISLFALAGVAYYSLGIVATMFQPKEASNLSSAEKREVKRFDSSIGEGIDRTLESGHTFTVLIVGVNDDALSSEPASHESLVVPRRAEASVIYLARFDKERRAMELCVIPPSTVLTVDYVEMELGKAYGFKDAKFVRDQVSSITGVGVDYLFEFTGKQFTAYGPKTSYTVPVTLTVPLYTGDGSYLNFEKGDTLRGADLYTYLHYNGYKPSQFADRAELLHGIFLQTMVKYAASPSAEEYYNSIRSFGTDMNYEDVSEVFEVLTALPALIDSNEQRTTVIKLDLFACGSFDDGGRFLIDRAAAEELYKPYLVIPENR